MNPLVEALFDDIDSGEVDETNAWKAIENHGGLAYLIANLLA